MAMISDKYKLNYVLGIIKSDVILKIEPGNYDTEMAAITAAQTRITELKKEDDTALSLSTGKDILSLGERPIAIAIIPVVEIK